jgi:hypothetical protein
MRELAEFRFFEEDAQKYLDPEDGEVLGDSVRKLVIDVRDARYEQIGRIAREHARQRKMLFTAWDIYRKYTKSEMEAAELFYLRIRATLQPAGENCGTEYDDAAGCSHCGAGAPQLGGLRLDPSRISRSKSMARTIAYNEVIFSAQLVEAFREHGITGARFLPVWRKGGKSRVDSWYQLEVCSRPVEVVEPTRFGSNPFDLDESGEFRCPLGHVTGLSLLSEIWVRRESYDGSDLCATRQHVGMRSRNGGLFRPYPLLLISPRLRQLLEDLEAKGYELEVAHCA